MTFEGKNACYLNIIQYENDFVGNYLATYIGAQFCMSNHNNKMCSQPYKKQFDKPMAIPCVLLHIINYDFVAIQKFKLPYIIYHICYIPYLVATASKLLIYVVVCLWY